MLRTSGERAPQSSSGKAVALGQEEEGPKSVWFRYYGPAAFKVIYDHVISLRIHEYLSLHYISGTLGCGKSYILETVAGLLMQEKMFAFLQAY